MRLIKLAGYASVPERRLNAAYRIASYGMVDSSDFNFVMTMRCGDGGEGAAQGAADSSVILCKVWGSCPSVDEYNCSYSKAPRPDRLPFDGVGLSAELPTLLDADEKTITELYHDIIGTTAHNKQ